MPALDPSGPEVVESVAYDVTRDDVYAMHCWINSRLPGEARAMRTMRRMYGVITFGSIPVMSAVTAGVAYLLGKPADGVIVITGMFTLIYASVIIYKAWRTRMGLTFAQDIVRRTIRKNVDHGDFDAGLGPCVVAVTDEAIVSEDPVKAMRLAWATCSAAEFAPDAMYFLFGTSGACRVPLRAFAEEGSRNRFVQAVVDRLPEATKAKALAKAGL